MVEVYHIRLNTGEDLVSEVTWPEIKPGNETHVILHNPMKIIAVPSTKSGFVQLSLMQWVFNKITSEQEFNIFSRDILTMSTPTETLIDYYFQTVEYFDSINKRKSDSEILDYLDNLERELDAVEESDRLTETNNLLDPELEKTITEFLNTLSSNNKGTLH